MYAIKHQQTKSVGGERYPSIEAVAAALKQLHPKAHRGEFPYLVIQVEGGEHFPLGADDSIRLAELTGQKEYMTGLSRRY